jgi:hypothetical protein
MEDEVERRRVGEREVDDGVGVGGAKEMGTSRWGGGFRGRGNGRAAEEASQETRLRAKIIDVGLVVTVRSTTIGKKQERKTDLEGLSRDGCSLRLGSGLRLGNVMDD